jgi:WD40 repeat protein
VGYARAIEELARIRADLDGGTAPNALASTFGKKFAELLALTGGEALRNALAAQVRERAALLLADAQAATTATQSSQQAVRDEEAAHLLPWPDQGTLLSPNTGKISHPSITQPLRIRFSDDGRFLAVMGEDDRRTIWEVATGEPATDSDFPFDPNVPERIAEDFRQFHHSDYHRYLTHSPEGIAIVIGRYGSSRGEIISLSTGRPTSHPGFSSGLSPDTQDSIAVSQDRRFVVTRPMTLNKKDSLILWDAATGAELQTLHAPISTCVRIAFSPDGLAIALVDHFGDVRIWRRERPWVPRPGTSP